MDLIGDAMSQMSSAEFRFRDCLFEDSCAPGDVHKSISRLERAASFRNFPDHNHIGVCRGEIVIVDIVVNTGSQSGCFEDFESTAARQIRSNYLADAVLFFRFLVPMKREYGD